MEGWRGAGVRSESRPSKISGRLSGEGFGVGHVTARWAAGRRLVNAPAQVWVFRRERDWGGRPGGTVQTSPRQAQGGPRKCLTEAGGWVGRRQPGGVSCSSIFLASVSLPACWLRHWGPFFFFCQPRTIRLSVREGDGHGPGLETPRWARDHEALMKESGGLLRGPCWAGLCPGHPEPCDTLIQGLGAHPAALYQAKSLRWWQNTGDRERM